MPFQPGQLAGDYEVLDVLGKGGMGSVYRVRNVISDRIEAMKVLLEDIGSQPGIGERFIAEIRTLARLDHPNIAKLHTAFKVQNQLVMVMEFVEGTDLAERAREGSIPLYKVVGYVKQVLSALTYAHNHGVVHRDIKPSNIMVTQQGGVKLMDFGIAKSNAEPLLTRPGTTMGSLAYMSPEQVRGDAVDGRSDIYSVGVVLYELTAGRCPFESDSTYRIMDAQLNAPPPPPIEFNRALPQAVNDIILTALQKDPGQRFQNTDAFRRALESVAGSDGAAQTRLLSDSEPYVAPQPPLASPAGAPPAIATTPYAPPVSPRPEASAPAPGLSMPSASSPPPAIGMGAPGTAQPPAAVQPGARRSHRSLWMAVGAVACLCVLAAAVVAVPHFRKSTAASKTSDVAYNGSPTGQSASGVRDSQASSPTLTPLAREVPESKTDSAAIQPVFNPLPNSARAEGKRAKKEVAQNQAPPPQNATQPPQASTQAQTSAPPPPPPPSGPSEAEVNTASEALMKMQARADAVHQGLGDLQRQQAAQGLGLRGDIVASQSRMDSYMQAAQRALQGRDLQGAQKNMDSAERELSKLETFLGR
ncbi:MAG TPA: protein kinase [Bryobacteraceae bacterium]|jgi:serine/threonine-protein kinase|nr:protein kinase [Bryobacteraceae bacterium]